VKAVELPPTALVGQQSRVRSELAASLQSLNNPVTTQLWPPLAVLH
jgi:hypothetical protein